MTGVFRGIIGTPNWFYVNRTLSLGWHRANSNVGENSTSFQANAEVAFRSVCIVQRTPPPSEVSKARSDACHPSGDKKSPPTPSRRTLENAQAMAACRAGLAKEDGQPWKNGKVRFAAIQTGKPVLLATNGAGKLVRYAAS